jgi:hypothetical protein
LKNQVLARAIRQTRPIFYQQAESTINTVVGYSDHKARCGDLGPNYCGICSWLKWIVALDPTLACQQPHLHGNNGITEADATIFAQALETKFMEKRKNKYATIVDPFLIALDIPCDVNNQS